MPARPSRLWAALWWQERRRRIKERVQPLPDFGRDQHTEHLAGRAARVGRGLSPEDYVFVSVKGAPLNRDLLRKHVLVPALRATGLPASFLTYDLRHAHASQLIDMGVTAGDGRLSSAGGRLNRVTVDPEHGTSRATLLAFLPALAFVATFGVFFVDKNREARTVLGSWRGLLVVFAVVAGYLVISVTLHRAAGQLAPLLLTGVVLGLAAWIVRPYYVDSTVNRTLVTDPVPEAGDPVGADDTDETAPTAAGGPVVVASGPLAGIGHRASGTASLIRAADGSTVVRLSDFDVEGVPDPRVHLVEGEGVERPGGTDLGRLPGNRGSVLDIPVPAGPAGGPGWTILIWCRAFSVPVANAALGTPPA